MADLEIFLKSVEEYLAYYYKLNRKYLYAIDVDSNSWYSYLFSDCSGLGDKLVKRCQEVKIIYSAIDWAGIYNKCTRVGVPHYKNLEVSRGNFANLLIPEIYKDPISFYDLDELECIMLEHLAIPHTINDLIKIMHQYLDEETLKNNLKEYEKLIVKFLKQLVLQKAVMPVLQ